MPLQLEGNYGPDGLVLDVVVRKPAVYREIDQQINGGEFGIGEAALVPVRALVDTGACITMVDESLAYNLPKVGNYAFRNAAAPGRRSAALVKTTMHIAEVVLGGSPFLIQVASKNLDPDMPFRVLIGRDLLASFELQMNGVTRRYRLRHVSS